VFKNLLILSILSFSLNAQNLKEMISNMIIIGYSPSIHQFIEKNSIGGVILFSKDIKSPKQLKTLTTTLQSLNRDTILIATDQEGGAVQRLKKKNGFKNFPKPIDVASLDENETKKIYTSMAKLLKKNGINTNFAPSVDLSLNPKNKVIVKYGRSFGSDSKVVIKYSKIFIDAMREQGIISVIKHFPGHGSSLKDSHNGFVDVSNSWSVDELEPFYNLIQTDYAKAVMSAHIFNKNLDPIYPATLSFATNTKLLKEKMNFNGVLISDDLQMGAISKHYDLNSTCKLAINSGIDMLLFGNVLAHPLKLETIIDTIYDLVQKGIISREKIIQANEKINRLKKEVTCKR
jgi:beta-N-acetylhexosaminidase